MENFYYLFSFAFSVFVQSSLLVVLRDKMTKYVK